MIALDTFFSLNNVHHISAIKYTNHASMEKQALNDDADANVSFER